MESVMKTVASTDVPTQIDDILDAVAEQRSEFVITKDGHAVARVVPIDRGRLRSLEELRGSVTVVGDIVAPLDEEWEAHE
jgi:antitoxin (DNA-binding transcriptional repressor) of toxin-antitoxin stability system